MAEDHGASEAGNSLGPEPEIAKKQRLAKERAAQSPLLDSEE